MGRITYREMEDHVLRVMSLGSMMTTAEVYDAIHGSGVLRAEDFVLIPTTGAYRALKARGQSIKGLTWEEKSLLLERYGLPGELHWKNNVRYAFRNLKKATTKRPAFITEQGLGFVTLTTEGSEAASALALPAPYPMPHASIEAEGLHTDADAFAWGTIRQRRGQNKFRDAIRARYHDRCVVSECGLVDVLEAAHVVPFRKTHDHSADNGLLLRSDLHTLFDLDLFGIRPFDFTVQLAPSVAETPAYAQFQGRQLFRTAEPPKDSALRARWWRFIRRGSPPVD